jgi:hypothetical protein
VRSRLDRIVAIKILPSADPELKARFARSQGHRGARGPASLKGAAGRRSDSLACWLLPRHVLCGRGAFSSNVVAGRSCHEILPARRALSPCFYRDSRRWRRSAGVTETDVFGTDSRSKRYQSGTIRA